ncbi:hypothetical protein ACFQI7_08710 [Paenibacillus allorhizosphaerae]|uniref:Uncharacterized protein n=1 Tax=Paenibacillus allorhizosphaerae TaxID=2849866 RepID=A0ABN7TJN4_9BACL|nr:hypothetical protein [Paenibacillus allorhizosphaerae]CAG7639555.1 hypothetical protein PAECIP111802_02556 [Paenibacillus allorhizosphaerae]
MKANHPQGKLLQQLVLLISMRRLTVKVVRFERIVPVIIELAASLGVKIKFPIAFAHSPD